MSDVTFKKETIEGIANALRSGLGDIGPIKGDELEARTLEVVGMIGSGGSSTDLHYVTFKDHTGTVELGKKAVAHGDNCANPIDRGVFDTPTRESDAQYNYEHVGWANTPGGGWDETILNAITEDKIVYAAYAAAVRHYTISYYDGDTLLKSETLAYGSTPSYKPTKEGYTFNGWNPTPVAVAEDASYTATWTAKIDMSTLTWAQIEAYSKSGEAANVFDLGAAKTFTYKSYSSAAGGYVTNTVIARIVDFYHDDLADGTGKAGITLEFLGYLLPGAAHGVGTSAQKSATWPSWDVRTSLKNFMTESSMAFPSDLYSRLKEVTKKTGTTTCKDICFLPSASELGDTTAPDEGDCYALFRDSNNRKYTNNGAAVGRFTRTKSGYDGNVYVVNTSGSFTTASQGSSTYARYGMACI